MRKLLLSVLLCLTSVVAWAQEAVAPPTDATYYDYVLSGVANWPEQGTEDLQDNVVVAVKGNDVYVNGLCGMLPQAWVKGVRNGSNVTFAAGQYFGKDTAYGYGALYFAGFGEANEVEDLVCSFDETSGVYTTQQWVLITDSPTSKSPYYYITGLTLTPGKAITDEPIEPPTGLTTRDYELTATKIYFDEEENLKTEEVSRYLKLGVLGNDVYVRGLCAQLPYAWVKGTLNGDDATFEKGQFYGVYSDMTGNYPLYFGGNYFGEDFVDMQFDYDFMTASFSKVTTYMVLNSEKSSLEPYEKYANVKLSMLRDEVKTPAAPSVVEFQPYVEQYDMGYVRFSIPTTDTSGKALIFSKLGYAVYSDKGGTVEPITFTPSEYDGLDANTTVLPYEMSNGSTIYLGGSFLILYSWMKDFDRIGVQAVYTGGGEEKRSDIVWYDINTGIESVKASAGQHSQYFDLQGRRVDANAKGVVIRKTTLSDGSVKTVKIVR